MLILFVSFGVVKIHLLFQIPKVYLKIVVLLRFIKKKDNSFHNESSLKSKSKLA
nr:MAG TPA: hypothetical protein [Caudoviricetes sp.]